MEKFILANGCALRMSDTVKGEKCIVLIHGYLESIDIFETLINVLKPNYRVISFDVPGHGISEVLGEIHTMEFLADTLHSILEQSNIKSCYVAGHSMGGYIATKFAQKYPKNCDGLIMIHSTFGADTEQRIKMREKEIELILGGKKELLAKINPSKAIAKQNKKRLEEIISNMEDQAIMTDDDGAIALLKGLINREDMTEFSKTTKTPILCLWGKDDEFIPIELAEEFIKENPQIESIIMEDSGHLCFLEQQNEFVDAVNNFTTR